MNSSDLRRLFAPLVQEIILLVGDQINKIKLNQQKLPKWLRRDVKAIFLVGGFGSSQYLKKCLQEAYPDIEVKQPTEAQEAIVQGAVLSQLPQTTSVKTSIAKRHWGTRYSGFYNADEDAGQPKYWDAFFGRDMVSSVSATPSTN